MSLRKVEGLPGAPWDRPLAGTLDRITVRRVGDRIVAEDADGPDGLALWPMYHSARAPLAPWGLLVTLLTAASPVRRLAGPLALGNPLAGQCEEQQRQGPQAGRHVGPAAGRHRPPAGPPRAERT